MADQSKPIHVSLLALPEAIATPIHGIYETLRLVDAVAGDELGGRPRLFDVDIVGPARGTFSNVFSLPIDVQRSVDDIERTDIVVMASMLFENQEWTTGRYPETIEWLLEMHAGGADLASACAGALVLAETGLLDGLEATTHWAFAPTFRRNFPDVRLRVEELLITTGRNHELVMSGAASSWQDLILFLIARHASPTTAQAIGKFLLYQWHRDSQAPYMAFVPPETQGDAVVSGLVAWVEANYAVSTPVEQMVERSGLPPSSFKRRFKRATGYSPLHYVQRLRVEEAKRLLEQSDEPIDEVAWRAGYEDPAAFRRLFKRITSLTPGDYRRKFRAPIARSVSIVR
jgi:transcriptional regulator GlxA family with amidase domain